jgi:non-lysosomal glucosylceramidase
MWIDLAPKFALRVWRYINFMSEQNGPIGTDEMEFLAAVYPNVVLALDTLESRWANHETHVPISKGIPDTTYDTISGHGYSSNVVMQWQAALEAAQNMAQLMGDDATAARYAHWQEAGRPAVDLLWSAQSEDELISSATPSFWNFGDEFSYFNAFVAPDGGQVNPRVHSDMLFGDFYARMTGLSPVVSDCQATESLETTYFVNGELWSMVGNHGPLGLVNVRGINGEQHFTEQGDEGWTGAMLLNAAYQIRVGRETGNAELIRQGWDIVFGFYNVVYSSSPDSQGWFGRTPEGYTNPDDFRFNDHDRRYSSETGRAPKYMRALAIWAVLAAVSE